MTLPHIDLPTNAIFIGGLIGSAEDVSKINKCSAEVKINMPASKNSMNIGGLIGQTKNVKEVTFAYSGSTINILDGDVKRISKTSIGGLVGYNVFDGNGKTKFSNCVTLTCVNYAGLVGYIYNLENYGEEYKLVNENINNVEKITSFANIGNIIGSCYQDPDSLKVSRVDIEDCYFSKDITMMAKTYAVGNNYNVDCYGLKESNYNNCVTRVKASSYASVGARLGSRIKPFNIDGSTNKFTDFEKTNEFVIFAMVTASHTAPKAGILLEGKFLYGGGQQISVDGALLKVANDSIVSKLTVVGSANTATQVANKGFAVGLLANATKNTLINECMSNGSIVSEDAKYVGGLVGFGEATVIKESQSYANIQTSKKLAVVGGIAGELDRGGYWFCSARSVAIDANGQGSVSGGIAGSIPKDNSFIVNSETNAGHIYAPNDGTAGGLVGQLDGLIAGGKIGTGGSTIYMQGYYVGGVVGTVREGATNIFLNGFTININVMPDSIVVGGVCAYLSGSGYTIKNTTVNGRLRGMQYVGGIAGFTDSEVTIGSEDDGVNTVNAIIDANGENIGGIVGKATNTTIVNNVVTSTINCTGSKNVGGIAGTVISSVVYKNIVKSGNVYGGENVGGIVGYVHQPEAYEQISGNTSIYENTCSVYVYGTIKNVGGIVGFVMQNGTMVEKNTSSADVNGAENVGGIVGASSLHENYQTGVVLTLTENYKTKGNVTSSGVAGGIIGHMASTVTKGNILGESAAITISGQTAGGIVGKAGMSLGRSYSDESSTINLDTMSDKAHTISGTKNAGGIVGSVERITRIINVSVNVNTITGGNAGGIAGYGKLVNIESWKTLKFNKVSGENAGGLVGNAYGAIVGSQGLDSKLGTLEGKNCGGYFGYAYATTLVGENQDNDAPEEERYIRATGYTVKAREGGGSIGSIIGHASGTCRRGARNFRRRFQRY